MIMWSTAKQRISIKRLFAITDCLQGSISKAHFMAKIITNLFTIDD